MLYETLANPRQLARYKGRRQTTRQAQRAARRTHGSQEPTAAKLAYMKGLRKLIVGIWNAIVEANDLRTDAGLKMWGGTFKSREAAESKLARWRQIGLEHSPGVKNLNPVNVIEVSPGKFRIVETLIESTTVKEAPIQIQVLERIQRDAPSLIGEIGKKVAGHNAREMRRLVGIDPRVDPGTGPVIDAFREENLKLITNLTEDMFNRVGAIVKENLAGRVEDLAGELQDGLDFSRARANLIARDQTLKLNGQLTRVRQQNSGIQEYIWTTSRDERVRPEHAELDGQTFRWDNPPPPGHPGEDYQCRCTAYPVIPGLDEDDEEIS